MNSVANGQQYSNAFVTTGVPNCCEGSAMGSGQASAARPLPHHRVYGSVHGGLERLIG